MDKPHLLYPSPLNGSSSPLLNGEIRRHLSERTATAANKEDIGLSGGLYRRKWGEPLSGLI